MSQDKSTTPEDKKTSSTEGGDTGDKRKQSLYFPAEMLEDIKREAKRLDRSLSWVVQRAWKTASEGIKKIPSLDNEG